MTSKPYLDLPISDWYLVRHGFFAARAADSLADARRAEFPELRELHLRCARSEAKNARRSWAGYLKQKEN